MGSIPVYVRPVIRTSDRGQFRRCRLKWDFSSKIRRSYEYTAGVEPLDFGIAVHEGADVYYDPLRWNNPRELVQYEATQAFIESLLKWKRRLMKVEMWDTQKARWGELMELGVGMLEHYYLWAPENDTWFTPVKSEIEFEVPIPVPPSLRDYVLNLKRFRTNADGYLEFYTGGMTGDWVIVVYQGRLDLLAEDHETGKYVIIDHKTAAQFGQVSHLELDTQCGSYKWALRKMLNLAVDKVVYSEWRKDVPHPPKLLKSGLLSQNKAQATTVEMYKAEIKRLGHNPAWYEDFLPRLKEKETVYFRRTPVDRSDTELNNIEWNICAEAIDMLNDPLIYPNPDRWNCNGCQFQQPCIMKQDGSDWQWHLEKSGLYTLREQLPEEISN